MICSLSGPDKVGRKELRQRLILYSQERFAGVVPRKYRLITFSLVSTCLLCCESVNRFINRLLHCFSPFLFSLVVSQVVRQSDKRSDRLNAKHFD